MEPSRASKPLDAEQVEAFARELEDRLPLIGYRDQMKSIIQRIAVAAAEAERERCAKVAATWCDQGHAMIQHDVANSIASAIQASR